MVQAAFVCLCLAHTTQLCECIVSEQSVCNVIVGNCSGISDGSGSRCRRVIG